MNKPKQFLIYCLLAIFLFSCGSDSPADSGGGQEDITKITILYTNDEHGWMKETNSSGGAAGLLAHWIEDEGFTQDGPYLILSGGDMWTGPAISTWFQGESMVEIMNAMGYAAAAIGNHEFDFKIANLQARKEQANFPFLAANIREKESGEIPNFAIPYIIKEVAGIKVGIIGLSSLSTPTTTFPDNITHLNFIDYEDALDEFVPAVKDDGAQIIIVIGHICEEEMTNLFSKANELGITMLGGGHCHELVAQKIGNIAIIEGGSNFRSYAKCQIFYDTKSESVTQVAISQHENTTRIPDPEIEGIVNYWQSKVDEELSEVIGYTQENIPAGSNEMANMITDSWLSTFPNSHISITNSGGIRQSIPAGNISLETIVGVLPFENVILELDLTGSQLIDCLGGDLLVGGMTTISGYYLSDDRPIYADSTYSVLTTDFIYSAFDHFSDYDPTPYNTSTNWRQPLIDWIKSLDTSQENPLNNYLDFEPRQ